MQPLVAQASCTTISVGGNLCSNPACGQAISGLHTEVKEAVNIGVAAHITAASVGGPRFDPSLPPND